MITFSSKLQSSLFEMKLVTWRYSMVLTLNLKIVFLNTVRKIPFLGKFGTETRKCFVLNETQPKEAFKGADSEFDNCFLKFHPQNTYLG